VLDYIYNPALTSHHDPAQIVTFDLPREVQTIMSAPPLDRFTPGGVRRARATPIRTFGHIWGFPLAIGPRRSKLKCDTGPS